MTFTFPKIPRRSNRRRPWKGPWRKPRRRRRKKRGGKFVSGLLLLALAVLLSGFWWAKPPTNSHDLCAIFSDKRSWFRSARQAAQQWGIPESVQMALIHQESGFRAFAKAPRRKIFWIIPGPRLSSATGYAQALDGTWQEFQQSAGRPQAKRYRFDDAAHFVGWYLNEIHRLTEIPKTDVRRLYLAYHEGPAGFRRQSYLAKPWLLKVARQVEARAHRYQVQYEACESRLWFAWLWRTLVWIGIAAFILFLARGWVRR